MIVQISVVDKKGFTLIETLIYMVLFAIIIGGGMVAVYQIIGGSDLTMEKTVVEQEANFILRKIDWALTGSVLTFTVPDNLIVIRPGGTSVVFSLHGGNFEKDGLALNISSVKVSGLVFEELPGTPAGVKVTFDVSSLDDKISQEFTMTKYAKY